MAKIIDITEKLNFEEKPKIKIKNVTIEVDDSAPTALKLMEVMSGVDGDPTVAQMKNLYEIIFSEQDRAKIDKLGLNIKNWMALIRESINLIVGDQEAGEQVSHITTYSKIGTCWSRHSERNMAYRSIRMILKK